jgi:hypothetical protein
MSAESITDQVKRAKARWLKRVMQHPAATSTQKCLAFTISDRLNCVTLDCWASQETLARDIGHKSTKTVKRASDGLAELNVISRKRLRRLRYAPVFCPEDFDKHVSKNGQQRANTLDTDVQESFLVIHSKSSSTAADAEARKSKTHSGCSFNPKERGGIEISLAAMFGADGLDILARLASIDGAILDRLCQACADGALSDRDLAAARLAAQQA